MPLLDEKVRQQVTEALAPMRQPVEIIVYTRGKLVLPGADETGLQTETLELVRELAAANPLINVEERSLAASPEAAELGITLAPTMLLREAGSSRTNIRFAGFPGGYEFRTLLDALIMLGTGESGLGERSRSELARIDLPLRMQAFVTPTCPYCPKAVVTAYKFAFHNPNVIAEGVEASEFPRLSGRLGISGVPDTVISGRTTERVLGGQPDRVFIEAALRAAGVAVPA